MTDDHRRPLSWPVRPQDQWTRAGISELSHARTTIPVVIPAKAGTQAPPPTPSREGRGRAASAYTPPPLAGGGWGEGPGSRFRGDDDSGVMSTTAGQCHRQSTHLFRLGPSIHQSPPCCRARPWPCATPRRWRLRTLSASVSRCAVDFLQKPPARLDASDIRRDLSHELSNGRPPCHVRHHGNLGVQPKRACRRQRLRP